MSVYLLIAIVSAVVLLIMAALGGFGGDVDLDFDGDVDVGHFDIGHGDFSGAGISPLSVPIWLIFFTCFGSIGTIVEAAGHDTVMIVIVSAVSSFLMTLVTFLVLVRVFNDPKGSTAVGMGDLVGLEGQLLIPITRNEPGQVVVVSDIRGRVLAPAIADADIPTNSHVRITGVIGDSVKVEKIDMKEKQR